MWSYFLRTMQCFFCLYLLFMNGVFVVDGDEVKSVSVMEGDSVTLHTDITEIQRDDQILWMFGPRETRIAEIYKKSIDMYNSNETFRDRLKLDSQTGSLTITNITITHTGLYKLQIISNRGTSYKRFNVTVYAPLPIPVIRRDSSQCFSSSSSSSSSSKCMFVCSVLNMRDVNLSWYKGNSLLSSISVSDLNISVSDLDIRHSLEVEYQDKNTYRCVLSNPIRYKTQFLNINHLCQMCSELKRSHFILLIPVAVVLLAVIVVALCVKYWHCKTYKQTTREAQIKEEEIIYTEPILPQRFQRKANVEAEDTVYSFAMR
nr:uncharacterized protein LOC129453811 [Misgurnus anguillicaudatus]